MIEPLPDGRHPDYPDGPIIWPNVYAANRRKLPGFKTAHAAWLARTKESRNAKSRAYWLANKENLTAKQKEWNARNPEKIKAIQLKSRSKRCQEVAVFAAGELKSNCAVK